MPSLLKMPALNVTPDYIDAFFRANNSFLYQLVFDPVRRKLVPLNPYPDDVNAAELHYAGPYPLRLYCPADCWWQLVNSSHVKKISASSFDHVDICCSVCVMPTVSQFHQGSDTRVKSGLLGWDLLKNPAKKPTPNLISICHASSN